MRDVNSVSFEHRDNFKMLEQKFEVTLHAPEIISHIQDKINLSEECEMINCC